MTTRALLALALAFGLTSAARAKTESAPAPAADAPFRWQLGPSKLTLGHELTLDLPRGYVFLEREQAAKLLEKNGNFYNQNLLGIVASADESATWLVTIRYTEEGYVKDNEKVDADEILKTIREGTESANEERKSKGFPALTIEGWADPPRYEKSVHHLVWALIVSEPSGKSINYNTRILGRRGFVAHNLITPPERLDADKPNAATLLAATTFNSGARYADFKPGVDKVATYGIAALVAGGVGLKLVKIGLLAKFGKVILAVLIAGKKALILAFIAVAGFFKKLFGGKKEAPATVSAAAPPPPDPPAGDPPAGDPPAGDPPA
jgi:uncharacterized membrane-anchored protein